MEYRRPLILKDVFYDTYTHTIFYNNDPPKGAMEDPYCKRNLLLHPVTEEILQLPRLEVPGYTYGMEQFHYCFGHAYADTTIPLISVLEEVDLATTQNRDWSLFVFRHEFFYTDHHAIPLIEQFEQKYIDLSGHTYKDSFQDLQKVLTRHPVLFENLYSCTLFHFDTLVLGGISDYQRSIHNHVSKYPGRRTEPPVFTDKEVLAFAEQGKSHIARVLNIPLVLPKDPRQIQVILVNRRHNRAISKKGIALVHSFFQKRGSPYAIHGPFYMEELSFQQQIEVFLQADFIISPHGSALFHLAWSRRHSFLLEVFQTKDARDPIFQSYSRAYGLSYARYIENPNKKEITDNEIQITEHVLPALEQICSILDRSHGIQ